MSNDISTNEKYHFFRVINQELINVGNNRELIILGNINGKTGKRARSDEI